MFQIYSPSSLLYCMPQRADELVALPSGFWWGLASWGNRRRTREREWSWGLHSPDSLPAGCHRLASYPCGRPHTAPAIAAPLGCGTYSVVHGPSCGLAMGPPLLVVTTILSLHALPAHTPVKFPYKLSLVTQLEGVIFSLHNPGKI